MAKKRGEKYEAILNAATKVFAQYGYHQTQVTKIAKEAQVADGTIYLYFKSKEDILISLFDEKMGGLLAAAEKGAGTAGCGKQAQNVNFYAVFLSGSRS